MKVRTHLVFMAAAVLLPLALFSAIALALLMQSEREAARRSVHETTKLVNLAVEREISAAESSLRVLASSEKLNRGDLAGFHERAVRASVAGKWWIILYDANGQQLLNSRLPYGVALPMRSLPGRNAKVIAKKGLDVSDIYMAAALGKAVVTVDIPVFTETGGPYVLAQAFNPDYFNQALASTSAPATWIIGLFDGAGNTIARTHRAEEFVGKPGDAQVLATARTQGAGELMHPSPEGIDIFDVFVRSRLSGWTVAVGVPVTELDANAFWAVSVATFGLLATLAVGGWIAVLHGRRLSASIERAAETASRMGRGPVPPVPRQEIEELDTLHEALARANDDLLGEKDARSVAEAERAALYASEQEARSVAEAQNKAKDDFLAMLGHELRNPLSAITGAVGVLKLKARATGLPGPSFDVIERQSQHLAHIVDDLLDVSRVMSGKIRLDRRPIDLSTKVRRVLGTLEAAGRTRQHEVVTDLEEAWVDADLTRLDQIVSNLLVNAFKYTPQGGTVRVSVKAEGEDAVLVVQDNGVGIEPELLPRIFDIFVQGTPTLDRAQGGLGIGLSLVKRLVALHDATIEAESPGTGQGSKFTARFHRIGAPLEAAPVEAPLPAPQLTRVLVVEDNPDSRSTLVELLSLSGYDCVEAGDGLEAVALAPGARPDIGVLDIGLPGLTGYEVAMRLRADPRTKHMKLVALTGYGQDSDRQRALAAGFDAHLVKPAAPDVLLKTLAGLLGE
ncbi:MAG: ATP-binding protein [Burkholderiaceae bacterium]